MSKQVDWMQIASSGLLVMCVVTNDFSISEIFRQSTKFEDQTAKRKPSLLNINQYSLRPAVDRQIVATWACGRRTVYGDAFESE